MKMKTLERGRYLKKYAYCGLILFEEHDDEVQPVGEKITSDSINPKNIYPSYPSGCLALPCRAGTL